MRHLSRMTSPLQAARVVCARAAIVTALLASLISPQAASPIAAAASMRGPCPNPARATAPTLPHGALAMYCVPKNWNGDLVVWAHGYVDRTQPVGFYSLTFSDGNGGTVYLPELVQGLGFAFATTSYRINGLVILQGVQDVEELVDGFVAATGEAKPVHTYQVGASEGGAISALLAERSPQRFSGALALCGPIGNFRSQVDYVGDMRVLFDHFYPGVLPGGPVAIPLSVINRWTTTYLPAVQRAIAANPEGARQMYRVLTAPVNPDSGQIASTATDVLWYNVFGTNDARAKLHGNPYSNLGRFYTGSDNDFLLNLTAERVSADPAAIARLAPYETTGRPTIPLVTLHTTGDDIIPFWHEIVYFFKAKIAGNSNVTQIPVNAYGHCNFALQDLLGAFSLLVLQVSLQPIAGVPPTNVNSARNEMQQHITSGD